ncbi:hypothetical protein ABZX85_42640 [Streptomyces sp. NPDC004539]|uniref:hypothetical protein n=1 Tax=Streptomyces sp. NPDC004539 TaxID=3154280 RepID=UPI0033A96450
MAITRNLALAGDIETLRDPATGWTTTLCTLAAAHLIGEPALLHRKLPSRLSAGDAHSEPVERALRMHLISDHADQLAAQFDQTADGQTAPRRRTRTRTPQPPVQTRVENFGPCLPGPDPAPAVRATEPPVPTCGYVNPIAVNGT